MPDNHCHSSIHSKHLLHILDVRHVLCRDDIIWVLHYVHKKIAQDDPEFLELPKPRILRNFKSFTEISMLLLSRTGTSYLEQDKLRSSLLEALHGLIPLSYLETDSDSVESIPSS
ncbi:hypothetical protein [Paenibacillus crassostreae]|uniref:Uncharacterized protein n=1 Tax=Paenibacillus crassostreae TaxID=1763538 RepID=A0A162RL27_9BACL|nr:hypothetical protein [Paenibacillus crassostreae]AOZ91569.1 hypothetical protein LPB68_04635 [Paenibacillus crassostreae]OAB72857.1 hypothetical protein PNBC_15615 [Paenibacillus crassostreae]